MHWKSIIPQTLTEWIDKLKEVGKTENERQIKDSNAGRNSAGKADQEAEIAAVQKPKAEALAKQVDSGNEEGKTREHLEKQSATKRVKNEDGSREKLT